MCVVWFSEVKTRVVLLGQDSGLAQDPPLSTEMDEHCAPVLGDAQLFGGEGATTRDRVVHGWCGGELGKQRQEILRA